MAQTALTRKDSAERWSLWTRAHDEALTRTDVWVAVYQPELVHPTRGSIICEPYPYQFAVWEALDRGRRVVVLKARQIGLSAASILYVLRRCTRRANTTAVILSDKQATGEKRIGEARHGYQTCKNLPSDWPTLTTDNKLQLGWTNGSTLTAIPSSEQPGRGIAASDLILDEFAFWPWQEPMWSAIRPTISHGGNIAIISTPLMEGDMFHTRWAAAQDPGSEWVPFELDWRACPAYDDEWAEREKADYTHQLWQQEYECEFGHAGDAVFGPQFVDQAIELGERFVRPQPSDPPEPPTYSVGGDLAGAGRDETVLIALLHAAGLAIVDEAWANPSAPAPVLQAKIDEFAVRFNTRPWLDRTGVGWAIAQNCTQPVVGVAFTSGKAVTGDEDAPNIPVQMLISNLVLGLQRGLVGIPRRFGQLILGLRAYRWKQAGGHKTTNADWVDALALAYWEKTQGQGIGIQVW